MPLLGGARAGSGEFVSSAKEDCTSCRVIGTVACLGSSAYIAFHTQGKKGFHRSIGVFASTGLIVMGAMRALT